jgi:hypothetical protein
MSAANEYFRFTLDPVFGAQINQLRDEVLGVDRPNPNHDVHVTLYFVGSKHLTADQLAEMETEFAHWLGKPFQWRITDIRVGDYSPVVFLELGFNTPDVQARYQNLYEHIWNRTQAFGLGSYMIGATPKQHPTCHLTLTWAEDFDQAHHLVQKFKAAQTMPSLGTLIGSDAFELVHSPETIMRQWR